jgi:hypothetical protein
MENYLRTIMTSMTTFSIKLCLCNLMWPFGIIVLCCWPIFFGGHQKSFICWDAVAPTLGNATPDHKVLICDSDQEVATSVSGLLDLCGNCF